MFSRSFTTTSKSSSTTTEYHQKRLHPERSEGSLYWYSFIVATFWMPHPSRFAKDGVSSEARPLSFTTQSTVILSAAKNLRILPFFVHATSTLSVLAGHGHSRPTPRYDIFSLLHYDE
jgi:hypothetical protein